jgi:hypothetical protein
MFRVILDQKTEVACETSQKCVTDFHSQKFMHLSGMWTSSIEVNGILESKMNKIACSLVHA